MLFSPAVLASLRSSWFFFIIPPSKPTTQLVTTGCCSNNKGRSSILLYGFTFFPKWIPSPVFFVSEPIAFTYVYLSSDFWLRLAFSIYLASYPFLAPTFWLKISQGQSLWTTLAFVLHSAIPFFNTNTNRLSSSASIFRILWFCFGFKRMMESQVSGSSQNSYWQLRIWRWTMTSPIGKLELGM